MSTKQKKTKEVKEVTLPQYTVRTNLKTLKTVWNMLKELELTSVLDGGEIPIMKLVSGLLETNLASDFIKTVTIGLEDIDVDALDVMDIVGIITNFFERMAGLLSVFQRPA